MTIAYQLEELRRWHDIPLEFHMYGDGEGDDTKWLQWLAKNASINGRRGVTLPALLYRVTDTIEWTEKGTTWLAPGSKWIWDPEDPTKEPQVMFHVRCDTWNLGLPGAVVSQVKGSPTSDAFTRDRTFLLLTQSNDGTLWGRPRIEYFKQAIWCCVRKDGDRAAHNTFRLGRITNSKYAVRVTDSIGGNRGYCNGNTFYDAHITHAGSVYATGWDTPSEPKASMVLVEGWEVSGTDCYGFSMGGDLAPGQRLQRAVYCEGHGCHFYVARAEGATLFQFGPKSYSNLVIGSHQILSWIDQHPGQQNRADSTSWGSRTQTFPPGSPNPSYTYEFPGPTQSWWQGEAETWLRP